jgi:hypothetical protein
VGVGYKKGGLDHYDTILLHQNAFADLWPQKRIVPAGLPYLDSLAARAKAMQNKTDGKTILVASTWGERGALKTYGSDFILKLSELGYHVVVRPHPYSKIHAPDFLEQLQKELPGIPFDYSIDNLEALSKADILVSDISGVRLDFFLCFGRPVVSLECDAAANAEYEHNEWLIDISSQIGAFVRRQEIDSLPQVVQNIHKLPLVDRESILLNFGTSKTAIADYLEALLCKP